MLGRVGLLLGIVALVGCTEQPIPAPVDPDPMDITGDAGIGCVRPGLGCPCTDQPPIDCYLEPTVGEDGRLMCARGTRYCRGGAWSGCESVETYTFRTGAGIAPLVTGPTECNACDPACAISRDEPGPGDLPGNSTDVDYDPVGGGIRIDPFEIPGTPELPDSDGDGVPDIADECDGPGAIRAADGSCYGDKFFFHDLPYGGPAQFDPLDVSIQVRTADVYFLMDTTGSMGGEINRLRSTLTSGTYRGCSGGIIGAIRCTIPDAWFGVGYHDDYPVSPYGYASSGDQVYRNLQDITASVPHAQSAVNNLYLHSGNDGPESQTQALWAVATGGGLGPYLSPRTTCPAGTWGYPCFRDGTIPIVMLFTDAPFHNGTVASNDYGSSFGSPFALPSTTAVSGNDTIASAYDVGDAATSWKGFRGNTCGTSSDYSTSCDSLLFGNREDVVFRFTVSTRTNITILTEGSGYDTVLSLRNASGEITCDDNGGDGDTSRIVRTLDPGTYYAVVTGYGGLVSGGCGDYRLSIGNTALAPAGYPVSWARTVDALTSRNIRVITIHSGGTSGIGDANALADATGSVSSSGTPSRYVYSISSDGRGLDDSVVDAIVDLANFNAMDISARAVDNLDTPIDERGFVEAITAVSFGPGTCTGMSGNTFVQCNPGTHVDFSVAFRNDFVMPTTTPQVFDFWIEVVGDGSFVLERVPVRVVVPPDVPLYPASGSYWRDYDSTDFCLPNERPDWTTLTWNAPDIPPGTSIRWELRGASTLAGLDTATPVTFTDPPTPSPVDLGARLMSGPGNFVSHLRVTAVLLSNDERTETPTLRSFEVRYTCIPQE